MIPSPLDIRTHSRRQMEECIMAIVGRAADNPRKFRDWLESLTDDVLRQEYEKIVGEPMEAA